MGNGNGVEIGSDTEVGSGNEVGGAAIPVTFALRNTGTAAPTDPGLYPQDARAYVQSDVYRLSVSAEGTGWSASLPNALAAVPFGESAPVTVYVTPGSGAGSVTLRATSVSDPSKHATVRWEVR